MNLSKRHETRVDKFGGMKRFIALLASLIVCLTTNAQSDRRPMNKEIARKIYEEAINAGRLELLDSFFADEYEGPDGTRGPAAFRATVAGLRTGFPDIRFTVEDLIAEGDRVAVRWSWQATHDGPFRGNAPTHKRVTNTGIVIYQFRDGKVIKNWLETDRLGALQQIGAVK